MRFDSGVMSEGRRIGDPAREMGCEQTLRLSGSCNVVMPGRKQGVGKARGWG